jgi:DNA/RNA-binding domain of Phe-tRNA-synthetase-like protein
MLPIGGEDWDRLESDLVRTRATGGEPFVGNERGGALEGPKPGEPIWCDRAGVTTRRFNWRQARRTRIDEATRASFFVFDTVAPYGLDDARAAARSLRTLIEARWQGVAFREETL